MGDQAGGGEQMKRRCRILASVLRSARPPRLVIRLRYVAPLRVGAPRDAVIYVNGKRRKPARFSLAWRVKAENPGGYGRVVIVRPMRK
jgi:hypothetical protein